MVWFITSWFARQKSPELGSLPGRIGGAKNAFFRVSEAGCWPNSGSIVAIRWPTPTDNWLPWLLLVFGWSDIVSSLAVVLHSRYMPQLGAMVWAIRKVRFSSPVLRTPVAFLVFLRAAPGHDFSTVSRIFLSPKYHRFSIHFSRCSSIIGSSCVH